jgi:hypothetical protein
MLRITRGKRRASDVLAPEAIDAAELLLGFASRAAEGASASWAMLADRQRASSASRAAEGASASWAMLADRQRAYAARAQQAAPTCDEMIVEAKHRAFVSREDTPRGPLLRYVCAPPPAVPLEKWIKGCSPSVWPAAVHYFTPEEWHNHHIVVPPLPCSPTPLRSALLETCFYLRLVDVRLSRERATEDAWRVFDAARPAYPGTNPPKPWPVGACMGPCGDQLREWDSCKRRAWEVAHPRLWMRILYADIAVTDAVDASGTVTAAARTAAAALFGQTVLLVHHDVLAEATRVMPPEILCYLEALAPFIYVHA